MDTGQLIAVITLVLVVIILFIVLFGLRRRP